MVLRLALPALLTLGLCAAADLFILNGRILPESQAAVSLFGATTPFRTETLADSRGRFRFRSLQAGEYTVATFIPGRGEARQTVEVGPGTANAKRAVELTIDVQDSKLVSPEALRRSAVVSTRQLSVPGRARREYAEAQRKLEKRDITAAVEHLEKTVAFAPQFSAAWNTLGTITYQTHEYARAESYFRKALAQDSSAYEPAVNLGGVLLTEGKLDEALNYNLYAVLSRPNDALANSQLGMTYFALENLSLGLKYLEIAKRLDAAHFSYPQLTLAEIHLRLDERDEAATEYEDFLKRHPDAPQAAAVRQMLAKLRR